MRMRLFVTLGLMALLCLPQAGTTAYAKKTSHSDSTKDSFPTSTIGPQMILIIRHAEKPGDGEKDDKDPNLSKRGFERAAALARVIPADFVRPDYLIATKRSSHSNRPVETIEPLAKALHEPIDEPFKDEEFSALAHKVLTDAKYANKIVLISWHHGKIPELAHALGASAAPDKWNSKVFDRVWEIKYQDGKASFIDLPQKALAGDSDK
jgi:phosphohistidine phosphatase SixA